MTIYRECEWSVCARIWRRHSNTFSAIHRGSARGVRVLRQLTLDEDEHMLHDRYDAPRGQCAVTWKHVQHYADERKRRREMM